MKMGPALYCNAWHDAFNLKIAQKQGQQVVGKNKTKNYYYYICVDGIVRIMKF
jgi:hypothetical protein